MLKNKVRATYEKRMNKKTNATFYSIRLIQCIYLEFIVNRKENNDHTFQFANFNDILSSD